MRYLGLIIFYFTVASPQDGFCWCSPSWPSPCPPPPVVSHTPAADEPCCWPGPRSGARHYQMMSGPPALGLPGWGPPPWPGPMVRPGWYWGPLSDGPGCDSTIARPRWHPPPGALAPDVPQCYPSIPGPGPMEGPGMAAPSRQVWHRTGPPCHWPTVVEEPRPQRPSQKTTNASPALAQYWKKSKGLAQESLKAPSTDGTSVPWRNGLREVIKSGKKARSEMKESKVGGSGKSKRFQLGGGKGGDSLAKSEGRNVVSRTRSGCEELEHKEHKSRVENKEDSNERGEDEEKKEGVKTKGGGERVVLKVGSGGREDGQKETSGGEGNACLGYHRQAWQQLVKGLTQELQAENTTDTKGQSPLRKEGHSGVESLTNSTTARPVRSDENATSSKKKLELFSFLQAIGKAVNFLT